jgi:16S rRNA processing protein RimM
MTNASENWIMLAVVTQPHGVRGQVKVKSFSDPEDGFARYKNLTDESGKPVTLRVTGQAQGQFIATVDGIKDRNAAELWRGRKLGVVRKALKETHSEHSYYISDLEGLEVVDAKGTMMGVVHSVANYGAGDLLEIKDLEGRTEFYSFTHANFPHVDKEARRITFTPPEILGSRKEEEGDET